MVALRVLNHHALITSGAYDEKEGELIVKENQLTWNAGCWTRKLFTTDKAITQAAWCYFQSTGPDAIISVLHPDSLTFYTQDGDWQTAPLPAHFGALWPLPQGLLLAV
jgi:hypothetical protein